MGMYDSVIAWCPKCNAELEYQSKSGSCCLNSYTSMAVPIEVAMGCEGDVAYCTCGLKWKLVSANPTRTVRMIIEPFNE